MICCDKTKENSFKNVITLIWYDKTKENFLEIYKIILRIKNFIKTLKIYMNFIKNFKIYINSEGFW